MLQVSSRCLIYKVHTAHCGRSFIVPHSVSLVKNFFLAFHRFFAGFASFRSLLCGAPLHRGTFISYHTLTGLSRTFFKKVLIFSVEATLVRRSINIPKARPTVNTFFAFSWTFFRLISAQLDMYIRAPAATTFRLSSAGITPPSHCLCPIAPSLP